MPTVANDQDRLRSLRSYELLDTPPEAVFDAVVQIASRLFTVPIALISLVDETRQWFKARVGLEPPQTHRDVSFCDHAIRQAGPMIVTDALTDPRFATNPLVLGDPKIRFYCGVPLRTPEGHALGTLCIIDRVPRRLDRDEIELLTRLATIVETEFELRRRLRLIDLKIQDATKTQRAKEMLASMLVHDLRSPLTTIALLASVLANDSPQSQEMVAELMEAAETMRRMLNDVLDICLAESGELKPRVRPLVAPQLIQALAPGWRRAVQARAQRLILDLPEVAHSFEGDPELLSRVLANLVGNAIQYGPTGQTITVGTRLLPTGATGFEVLDRCPTIPTEQTDAIFAAFERFEDGRMHPGGRGLGLAFCKLAVEAHGGTIGVEPAEGGNRFYFTLPPPPQHARA